MLRSVLRVISVLACTLVRLTKTPTKTPKSILIGSGALSQALVCLTKAPTKTPNTLKRPKQSILDPKLAHMLCLRVIWSFDLVSNYPTSFLTRTIRILPTKKDLGSFNHQYTINQYLISIRHAIQTTKRKIIWLSSFYYLPLPLTWLVETYHKGRSQIPVLGSC